MIINQLAADTPHKDRKKFRQDAAAFRVCADASAVVRKAGRGQTRRYVPGSRLALAAARAAGGGLRVERCEYPRRSVFSFCFQVGILRFAGRGCLSRPAELLLNLRLTGGATSPRPRSTGVRNFDGRATSYFRRHRISADRFNNKIAVVTPIPGCKDIRRPNPAVPPTVGCGAAARQNRRAG